jgi:hypothetical protein
MNFSAFLLVACLFGEQRFWRAALLMVILIHSLSSIAHISRDLVKNLFPEQDT